MQTYGKRAFEAIHRATSCTNLVEVREDGVWPAPELKEDDKPGDKPDSWIWNYAVEMEGPDAPDPLEIPSLPFPFTAYQLAAFMLGGIGVIYCDDPTNWAHEPDEESLRFGILGTKSIEVFKAAYLANHNAELKVKKLNKATQLLAQETAERYQAALDGGYESERVLEDGITQDEYCARVEQVRQSASDLKGQMTKAKDQADQELDHWRREMVRQLFRAELAASVVAAPVPVMVPVAELGAALGTLDATVVVPASELPDPERRLIALRELGGAAKWTRGRDGIQAWRIKGIQSLVAQEKAQGRKRSDEKTIRDDLRDAAEAESIEKRSYWNK